MTKKEINERIKVIKGLLKEDNEYEASEEFNSLACDLHQDKKYDILLEEFKKIKKLVADKTDFYSFELAYAFDNSSDADSSEIVYEHLLNLTPNNSAVLNNLSNIKKRKKKFKEAFDLISKAYEVESDDEIISNNYDSLNQIITEQREREVRFKHSLVHLEKENKFVTDKLQSFIQGVKKDENFDNGVLPLAKWKFKTYMKTDEQKAESLREQWLDKDYIINTGQRGEYHEIVYELNPFLEKALNEVKFKTINPEWIKGIEKLNIEFLDEINYYRNLKKLNKVNKKFREILIRDFDELTFNYLVKSNKATIILAGSLIETLLIYYLEKKKIKSIEYELNNRKLNKSLYDATLNDLLLYLEQEKLLKKHFVHLGNVSRIFRNFVHPGKELKEADELDNSKSHLCYISASELINNIISSS